jgi:hypothetical protein
MKLRLIALLMLATSSPALAVEPDADTKMKAEAAERFDRGLRLFDDGDNAGALAEFKKTYEILPNPVVRYNLGLVYAAMGRPVDAVDALVNVIDATQLSAEQNARAKRTLDEQRARVGTIAVRTAPESASIEVDGVEVARTPLAAPLRVAVGKHLVGASAEGHLPIRREVVVAGQALVELELTLLPSQTKRPANLTVRSRIPDAVVLIDGREAGRTPLAASLTVSSGRRVVELRRPGYAPIKREMDLGEGATAELDLDLQIDPKALTTDGALLVLATNEQDLQLFVDDRSLGRYQDPVRLPRGAHRLRLEAPGFLPYEGQITLKPGSAEPLPVSLRPTPATLADHEASVRFHRLWGWLGVGTGVALAAGGGAFLAVNAGSKSDALSKLDQAESEARTSTGDHCQIFNGLNDREECNAHLAAQRTAYDDAKSKDVVGYVGLGVGAAVAVVGGVLLLTGEPADKYARRSAVARGLRFTAGPTLAGSGLMIDF